MEYGVHLPLIGFDDRAWSLGRLSDVARAARECGFTAVCANDHLVFPCPWLDGPTALAAVLAESGGMELMTSVAIAVVRGPVQTAKTLAALDILSGGRLVVGLGPGSSAADYAATGVPYEERWARLDEMVGVLRALWDAGQSFQGRFYSSEGVALEPRPPRGGPPIWIGSWGSDAGLRRTARLADGWLASAYNTTPVLFGEAGRRLQELLEERHRDAAAFPNALATMFMHITESRDEAGRVLGDLIGRAIHRPLEQLAERLLVGPPEACAEKLAAYRVAGLQRVLLWPVIDEPRQVELFSAKVAPLVGA
jgi:alkanesulfonate monooxygenase SsuD/methylene tetrahydromethanopterin reductase-like flavin-dependent oxidoreductase (luciferase family)